jgi:magnesium chelatase subunit D
MCRAAAALAGWEGRDIATVEDVRRVAPLVLAHRRRRQPFDNPGIDPEEIDRGLGDEPPPGTEEGELAGPAGQLSGDGDQGDPALADAPTRVVPLSAPRSTATDHASGRRSLSESRRGRIIGDRSPNGVLNDVAVGATVRAAAIRQADSSVVPDPQSRVMVADLREAVREEKTGNLLILAVDASGSMGVHRRMEAVKGAVLSLLLDAYQRRDRVALVTFSGQGADVVLRPTGSVEVARARMEQLSTGGRTPLAAGIEAAVAVAGSAQGSHRPFLILISDGRATSAPVGLDPLQTAMEEAAKVRRLAIPSVVLDVEEGHSRLGLAGPLAHAMGARHLPLSELSAAGLTSAIQEVVEP